MLLLHLYPHEADAFADRFRSQIERVWWKCANGDITEDTIRKWIRGQTKNRHTSSTEVQKLRQENREIRAIIGEMVLHQRRINEHTFLGS